MTPYPQGLFRADGGSGGAFLRGATLDLTALASPAPAPPTFVPPAPDVLAGTLRTMRDDYGIDTVGGYDLGAPGRPGACAAGRLFETLAALGMRVVPRLEEYDPSSFSFAGSDVDRLLERYAPLLEFVAAPTRRDRVAYLAVNMPLDDPRVRHRLGGGDSPLSVRRQLAYAETAVARLRALLSRNGAGGMPIYLGVFYGWDGGYRPPCYAPAGADGYFLTSYGYPGAGVPTVRSGDAALIDEPGRRRVMHRFTEQYGHAPVVVEYGVHTAARHGGRRPAQTAGLVADRAAKRCALVATTAFYRRNFPSVRGSMYFGFNVYKREGDPPATLDFGLEPRPQRAALGT